MIAHITKKLLTMIPILILVSIILFILLTILPGDAAAGLATADASDEYVAQMREEMGLNRPAYIRYLDWISGMFRGDFGKSLLTGQPVLEKIRQRLPVTLELAFLSMLISIIIALPVGILSAVRRNSAADMVTRVISMLGVAMPPFWLGMLLIMLFSIALKWLPASGYISFFENPARNLAMMIMPALAIGAAFSATVMRQTRSALLEVLDQEYIMTARAKGLRERIIVWKHALRNALIPVVTVTAMQIGRLIGGAVVCETMFAMPGIGREIVDAILSRDYPVVMGMIMTTAVIVIVINTLMDIVYVLIDPRISHSRKAG